MELWDAYDKDFCKIDGVTLVRGEKIPDGMYHLVADVIVRHKDGEYLLMQRDPGKHYGGMWEATAGGSAIKGENAYECAVRELREETGIESADLIEVGREAGGDVPEQHLGIAERPGAAPVDRVEGRVGAGEAGNRPPGHRRLSLRDGL